FCTMVKPPRVHTESFTIVFRRLRNKNTWPLNGSRRKTVRTSFASPSKDLRSFTGSVATYTRTARGSSSTASYRAPQSTQPATAPVLPRCPLRSPLRSRYAPQPAHQTHRSKSPLELAVHAFHPPRAPSLCPFASATSTASARSAHTRARR